MELALRQEELVIPMKLGKQKTPKSVFLSTTALIKAAILSAAIGFSAIGTAQAQISSCAYGEPVEFDNSGSIVFTADATNSQLFTAQ